MGNVWAISMIWASTEAESPSRIPFGAHAFDSCHSSLVLWAGRERKRAMSSSAGMGGDAPDLVCQLDCAQGMVDALTSVRWKRHQDAVVEISEHGVVLIVEESGCLQAKVYLKREVLCPQVKTTAFFVTVDSPDACIYAEIRTRIPDTISWDYNFQSTGNVHATFTIRVLYKYKFLRATTSHIPNSVLKDNRGSKVTIGRGGMLKIQHLVSVKRAGGQHSHGDTSGGIQQLSRIAYIEFFVKPEEDEIPVNDT
ncbi:hypothetical protein BHE74_00058047 [Ensete ventricosum]|nr:hypothetical protein BHE74_00058047 [Ensete ventricosum]